MRTILVHLNVRVDENDPRLQGEGEDADFKKFYDTFEGIIEVGNDFDRTGVRTENIAVVMIDEV